MKRLLIIGTGASLPVIGWGAVEAILWEQMQRLPGLGVTVDYLDVRPAHFPQIPELALKAARSRGRYDFVHFHYDQQYQEAEALGTLMPVAMTSHFAYIGVESHYQTYGWWPIVYYLLRAPNGNFNFVLSDRSRRYFVDKGGNNQLIYPFLNGASDKIRFAETAELKDRSIYLAKITQRKGQYRYGSFDDIDFVGNIRQEVIYDEWPAVRIAASLRHYIGEWSRTQVENDLTRYANLVLLSLGEEAPLVIREALMAGLGVVVSECAVEGLDCSLPFVDVVPDDRLDDLTYVREVLAKNRAVSCAMRKEIRQYALEHYSWTACCRHYIASVEQALATR